MPGTPPTTKVKDILPVGEKQRLCGTFEYVMSILLYIHSVSILNAVSINSYQNVTKKQIVTSGLAPNSRLLPVIFVWGSWKFSPVGLEVRIRVDQRLFLHESVTLLRFRFHKWERSSHGKCRGMKAQAQTCDHISSLCSISTLNTILVQDSHMLRFKVPGQGRTHEVYRETELDRTGKPSEDRTCRFFFFKWKWHRMRDQRHLNYKFIKRKSIFSPMSNIRSSY